MRYIWDEGVGGNVRDHHNSRYVDNTNNRHRVSENEIRMFVAEFVGCRPVDDDDEFIPVDDMDVGEGPAVEDSGKQKSPPVPGGHMQ